MWSLVGPIEVCVHQYEEGTQISHIRCNVGTLGSEAQDLAFKAWGRPIWRVHTCRSQLSRNPKLSGSTVARQDGKRAIQTKETRS